MCWNRISPTPLRPDLPGRKNILVNNGGISYVLYIFRRAFLKYSALTAVAVAGASLLGGCEYQDPKNPVCKTLPGAIKSDLNVIAGLKSMKIEKGTCTLEVDIESARANTIRLVTDCFSIAVKDSEGKSRYFSMNYGGVQILDAENSQIEQKKPVTIHLAAFNFPS